MNGGNAPRWVVLVTVFILVAVGLAAAAVFSDVKAAAVLALLSVLLPSIVSMLRSSAAASAASETRREVQAVTESLNGGFDERIARIVRAELDHADDTFVHEDRGGTS